MKVVILYPRRKTPTLVCEVSVENGSGVRQMGVVTSGQPLDFTYGEKKRHVLLKCRRRHLQQTIWTEKANTLFC